jgi:hypothetical protein
MVIPFQQKYLSRKTKELLSSKFGESLIFMWPFGETTRLQYARSRHAPVHAGRNGTAWLDMKEAAN